jgi:hypothetical protein
MAPDDAGEAKALSFGADAKTRKSRRTGSSLSTLLLGLLLQARRDSPMASAIQMLQPAHAAKKTAVEGGKNNSMRSTEFALALAVLLLRGSFLIAAAYALWLLPP